MSELSSEGEAEESEPEETETESESEGTEDSEAEEAEADLGVRRGAGPRGRAGGSGGKGKGGWCRPWGLEWCVWWQGCPSQTCVLSRFIRSMMVSAIQLGNDMGVGKHSCPTVIRTMGNMSTV